MWLQVASGFICGCGRLTDSCSGELVSIGEQVRNIGG